MNKEIEKAGTKIEYIVSHPEEYTSVDVEVRKVLEVLLQQERERIAEELVKIEREKWKDAKHCSCLGYAIVKVFGEKYEDRLTSIKTLNQ